MTETLQEVRAAIESLDEQIIGMIAQRVALAREAGHAKAAMGQSLIDPAREAAVVARASQMAREAGLPEDEIRALYWRLMAMSRKIQLDAVGS